MLDVFLLGRQAVIEESTGRALTRSTRAVALLGLLTARAGTPQSREQVAALFWPDSAEAQARTNLRRELHQLRRVLAEPGCLVVSAHELCWCDCPAIRVDVRELAAHREAALAAAAAGEHEEAGTEAAAALACYRGDFLPGLNEDWAGELRSELEQHAVELCDLLVAARSRTGDLPGAVAPARRRLVLRPLEERGHRTLMQLYADLGDRAAAVSAYHRCASVLERELGTAPDGATRALLRGLLDEEPTADRSPGGPAPSPTDAAHHRAPPAPEPQQLVGRAPELQHLVQRWQGAAGGLAGVALVRGGSGVGKTRLVAELAARVRAHGAVVATAECFGTAGRLALAPVATWLRQDAVRTASAALEVPWRHEVQRLVPAASPPSPAPESPTSPGRTGGPRAEAMVDAWQRHRFFEGVARALTGLGRPLLLVLDNLQWCDQETCAFVTFCLRMFPTAPVLVVATLAEDTGNADPQLRSWLAALRAAQQLDDIVLGPLGPGDTVRLAESHAGRPLGVAERTLLLATTGGFPLSVVEAVRSAVETGRPLPAADLTAVVQRRLEQGSPASREVAGLAAALGQTFSLEVLTEAADLPADEVVRGVDELWRRRIVRQVPEGYDFSHDLVRSTAYALVSPARRWLLHHRLAQALERLHAGDTDAVSARLAQQHHSAGRPDLAVGYYEQAAAVASARFAHGEAVLMYRTALRLVRAQPPGPRTDAHELALLEAMAAPLNAQLGYASAELQQAFERTVELVERLGRTSAVAPGLVALWSSRFVQGRVREAHQLSLRALALSGTSTSTETRAAAHFAVGGCELTLGHPAQGLRHFTLAAEHTEGTPYLLVGTRRDVHTLAWSAHACWLLGRDRDALARSARAIALARAGHHPYSVVVALAYGALTQQMAGNTPVVARLVAEMGQLCERYDFAYYRDWATVLSGWCTGADGIDTARRGVDALRDSGAFTRMPYWLSLVAQTWARGGQPAAARATLDAATAAARAHDDVWWLPEVLRLRAGLEARDRGVARLQVADRMARQAGSTALVQRCQQDLRALSR